jgi:hypothetical protein
MYHIFFILSSVDRHLGCFHLLAIVNHAAVYLGVQMSPQHSDFIFSGYLFSSGIDGLYDGSIFKFLRNHHTIFQSLHSHQYHTGFGSPYILTNISFVFWIIVILTCARWGLIRISLIVILSSFSYTWWQFVCLFLRNVLSLLCF